jgi:hypothetical protein
MDPMTVIRLISGVVGMSFLIGLLVVHIIIIIFVYNDYQSVPPSFRKLEPGLVWLLLIPCFPIVWNFWVFPKLADSFKAYFDSVGDQSVGNCGHDLALAYCICSAVSIIPYLGCLTGIAALVLLIMFLVKAQELKSRIPARVM